MTWGPVPSLRNDSDFGTAIVDVCLLLICRVCLRAMSCPGCAYKVGFLTGEVEDDDEARYEYSTG
jgi:hypothetical protein